MAENNPKIDFEFPLVFSEKGLEYLKSRMTKEKSWHKFECYLLKKDGELYLSSPSLVLDSWSKDKS